MSATTHQRNLLDPIPREHLVSITIDDANGLARCRFFAFDTKGYSTTMLALGSIHAERFVQSHPEILAAILIRGDGTILRIGC